MDRRLGCRCRAGPPTDRVAVPERRSAAKSTRGPRWTSPRPYGRACGSRTSSTGSSRSRSTARRPAPPQVSRSDLAVGHYKPINSDRFLNDCHEFIFHFTPQGATTARPPRARSPLPGPVEHRPVAGSGGRHPLPRQHLVHSVRNDPAARPRSPASGDLPGTPSRAVFEAARPLPDRDRDGSVHRPREHGCRVRETRRQFHRGRHRRDVPEGSGASGLQTVKNVRALPERGSARMRKANLRATAASSTRAAAEV